MGQLRITLMYRWIVLCIFCLSLCHNAFSAIDQGKTKVTLEVTSKPRGQVLHMLEKQAGVIFFYASHLLNTDEKISIYAVDKSLDEVLEKVFDGTGMEWFYGKDKIVSVKPKKEQIIKESERAVVDSNITSMIIRGTVIGSDGSPIPGATILVKNSKLGDVSDSRGAFEITAKRKDVLVISSIGYETMELPVNGKTILAQLNVLSNKLDETVVVAYGTTTNRLNTGNVASIKGKEIAMQPVSNPLQALQGRVPGLYINQASGVPGGGYSVELRGKNSLNNGNDPLYIVDGIPYESTSGSSIAFGIIGYGNPLNYIDPMSIERIDVLKDADATAIYGSRGANGVILITTKNSTNGKLNFDLNVRTGVSEVQKFMKLMDVSEYLKMRNEAFHNDQSPPGPLDYDLNGTWDTTKSRDWQKELIGKTASYQDYQGTLTGGNERLNFLLATGYHRETSVFPGQWNDKRYSLRASINARSRNDKLKIQFAASYLNDINYQPQSDITNRVLDAPIGNDIYNADGTLNWVNSTWNNPYGALKASYNSNTSNLIASSNLSYEVIKNLALKLSIGVNRQDVTENLLTPYQSMLPIYYTLYGLKNSAFFNFNKSFSYNVEPQITYNFSKGNHNLKLLVGSTILSKDFSQSSTLGMGFISDDLLKNMSAASSLIPGGSQNLLYKYNAVFGRINYNFQEKYILQVTARRDGSSRFGPGRQFANFGAVGGAWIFSSEKFFSDISHLISFGKIRGSYGITGNDQIGDYGYLDLYYPRSNTYQSITTLGVSRLFNKFFAWEKNTKMEIGLDLSFMNDKVYLSSSYYRNRSGNQLIGLTLPNITGFPSVTANLPAVVQNTGLEFVINTTNLRTKNFSWQSTFNISIPRNKLLSYPDLDKSGYQYVIGKSINVQKVYKFSGVNHEDGIYEFIDSSGKTTQNPNYDRDRSVLITIDPKYYGGFSNSLKYKKFQLDFLFQFVKKMGANRLINNNPPGQNIGNQNTAILDRWTQNNHTSQFQRVSTSNSDVVNGFYALTLSDMAFADASFIKLKSFQLSYNIPVNPGGKKNLMNIDVFVQGQNLLTFTKYKGFDPENDNVNSLPPLRTVVMGLNIRL